MIIDVNTYIGHWPFRQLRNNTAKGLIDVMDETGITVACVSSVHSIFYKDTQEGNRELFNEIAPYKERFLPYAVINPVYPGWKKDFLTCIKDMNMKGLELYPYYHQYNLTVLKRGAGQYGGELPYRFIFLVLWLTRPKTLEWMFRKILNIDQVGATVGRFARIRM